MAKQAPKGANRERMRKAIGAFVVQLDEYPGWRQWKRECLRLTLDFGDPFLPRDRSVESEFLFADPVGKQHALVLHYLALEQTLEALRECEFYFRRYPFHGLPVTRYNHLVNTCEMYFNRFYEFREKLKLFIKALRPVALNPPHDLGKLIRIYDNLFDQELRERNNVHHRDRFKDLATDHVLLMELGLRDSPERRKAHLTAYRRIAKEWEQRVRKRASAVEEVLEAVSALSLAHCQFLIELAPDKSPAP